MPVRGAVLMFSVLLLLAIAGCGGGETQSAGAPTGTWKVTVLQWKFPERQPLGAPQSFVMRVRNDDTRAIPNLILTISGLKTLVRQAGAASNIRPVWMPKTTEYGIYSPYNSTLATSLSLGPVAPGEVITYATNLTPLRRGQHEVGYRLSPALFGDNSIVNTDGSPAEEKRLIAIDPEPVFDRSFFDE